MCIRDSHIATLPVSRVLSCAIIYLRPASPQTSSHLKSGPPSRRFTPETNQMCIRDRSLSLIPLVVSLFHIDRCIDSNSEPEKCCPTKRTIGKMCIRDRNSVGQPHNYRKAHQAGKGTGLQVYPYPRIISFEDRRRPQLHLSLIHISQYRSVLWWFLPLYAHFSVFLSQSLS